jgi:uncharacterized membrane protein YidH (DUF202 family)
MTNPKDPADPNAPAGPEDPQKLIGPAELPDPADPGSARARTSLAWTRTALSFAAVGGVVLKKELIPGLIILATVPVIWQLGRLAHHRGRLELVTATIVAVALVALLVAILA